MATSTLIERKTSGSRFKTILWVALGLTTLFVFITSEVLLITDYPMYHAYRLQVIADRGLLIPHTLAGIFALLLGTSRSIAFSAASTWFPFLSVRSPGSLSPGDVRAFPEPPCRPQRGSSAPPPPSSPRATVKSPHTANGWRAPMQSLLPLSQAACSILFLPTGATWATFFRPSASSPSRLPRC